jgi:GNAT superfamily N-acetyltransferase
MFYRLAVPEDIPALTELRLEFLSEANGIPFGQQELLRDEIRRYFTTHLPNGTFIAWVCLIGETIIATSGISFYSLPPSYNHPNGNIGYIMNMYTRKEYRRGGIATCLFEKMMETGKQHGVGQFILNASRDGKGIYRRFGFIESNDEMYLKVDDGVPGTYVF